MHHMITVPAEEWERFAMTCDLVKIIDQASRMKDDQKKPISVRAAAHGSRLYTSFSVLYGGFSHNRPACAHTYRLVHPSAYDGDTTMLYHDEKAIQSGTRARDDHTGLIVSHKGQRFVCETRCNVVRALPQNRLTLDEAKMLESSMFSKMELGYFRMQARAAHGVTWHSCHGHPVARYGQASTLFWRNTAGRVEMDSLDDSFPLVADTTGHIVSITQGSIRPKPAKNTQQLSLF